MGLGDFFKGAGSGLISGAASLLGGGISAITGKSARNNEYSRQKEFAQNGIRWRVEDAKAAGIHPIFAIGANAPTYSPQAAIGTDFGLSDLGQNISRAIEAKQTREERDLADLQRENARLQNDYLRAQINRTNTETMWSELDYVTRQAQISEAAISTQSDQRPPSLPTTNQKTITKNDIGNITVKPSEITSPSSRYGSHNAGVGTLMKWNRIGGAIKPSWDPNQGDSITEDFHMSATAKARYALDALSGKVDPPPISEWRPEEQQLILSGEGIPVFDPFMFEWVVTRRFKGDKYYYNLITDRIRKKSEKK